MIHFNRIFPYKTIHFGVPPFMETTIFLQHVSSRNRPPVVFQIVPCWGSSLAAAFKERSTRLAMSGRVHGFLGLRWNFERTQIQKTMVYTRKYDHICGFGSQHSSRTCMTKCRNQCEIFGYGDGDNKKPASNRGWKTSNRI